MSVSLEFAELFEYDGGPVKGSIAHELPGANCTLSGFICPYLAQLEIGSESLGFVVPVEAHDGPATFDTRYYCMHPLQRQELRDAHHDCDDKSYQIGRPKDIVSEPICSVELDHEWNIANKRHNKSNPNA